MYITIDFEIITKEDSVINNPFLESIQENLHYLGLEDEILFLDLKKGNEVDYSMEELGEVVAGHSNYIVVAKIDNLLKFNLSSFKEIGLEHLYDNILISTAGQGGLLLGFFVDNKREKPEEDHYCFDCYSSAFKIEELEVENKEYREALLNLALKMGRNS